MCLGIPGEVVEIREQDGMRIGKVKFGGIHRDVCLECTPEVIVGDFVLAHVGFAISVIDKEEAAKAYKTLDELGVLAELTDAPPDYPEEEKEPGPDWAKV